MSTVYLVGAGPGDPGLLTLRGRELIEQADVLIYDYLANKEFLSFARPDCEIIYVGKKGGDHTLPQDDINTLLVDKALEEEGRMIVRLKGGDPYVFGRGAEEAEELVEAGIAFEVVPGVTSAVAAPAYAGIPVTHRRFASSVSFITGHEDPTKEGSAINWGALAASGSTLVFFMGVKNLPTIAAKLMEHGMRPDMPCALVHWGTTCRQRSFVSTLDSVAEEAVALGFKAPSLIIVGEVCSLKETLDWHELKPLLGLGVVVTRSREQASELTSKLRELGACCHEFPTIEISPLPDDAPVREAIAKLPGYDWLVFTSVNGVEGFWDVLDDMGLDARAIGRAKVAAIGPATATALCSRGVRPDLVPGQYVAESVVEAMLREGMNGKKVLIPRAMVAREVLPDELAKAGAEVTVLPVYETKLADEDPSDLLAALEKGEIHFVTFTSSSTVQNFFTRITPEVFAPYREQVKLVCIGPVTAKTLEKLGFTPDVVAGEYTIPGLVEALVASIT
ncbi:uroporphyrin-III C-methyltransferase [Desulfovibrio sp. X2]|uniref:uroporphyrinogen-III C-methyltransferase n=1 Tax=Desulfovibrio sp. X2 TaxID=941449 RepID=UPI000358A399|nr:uroporphyrinogen-III C-methyltransferase [Desulfovibrio sp. X2]EPR43866.1 uroporphyrin-III C-methyltransferase [Desulfovibrio sp. X2]